ncbi:MAG: DNA-3-methyladenine glycosylase 2 family protein [Pseudomonadota bacterium]
MKTRMDKALVARALRELSARDAGMAQLIKAHPRCPMDRGRRTAFECLGGSIIGQQLSTAAARTIGNRVAALSGGRLDATAIASLPTPKLRAAGLSASKARYLQGLARATVARDINFRALAQMSDDAVIEDLTQHTGVGVWTAQMFLMFGLRRPDVAAPGDLGLQRGLQRLHDLEERPQDIDFIDLMEPLRPWRSVASWYLWRLAD